MVHNSSRLHSLKLAVFFSLAFVSNFASCVSTDTCIVVVPYESYLCYKLCSIILYPIKKVCSLILYRPCKVIGREISRLQDRINARRSKKRKINFLESEIKYLERKAIDFENSGKCEEALEFKKSAERTRAEIEEAEALYSNLYGSMAATLEHRARAAELRARGVECDIKKINIYIQKARNSGDFAAAKDYEIQLLEYEALLRDYKTKAYAFRAMMLEHKAKFNRERLVKRFGYRKKAIEKASEYEDEAFKCREKASKLAAEAAGFRSEGMKMATSASRECLAEAKNLKKHFLGLLQSGGEKDVLDLKFSADVQRSWAEKYEARSAEIRGDMENAARCRVRAAEYQARALEYRVDKLERDKDLGAGDVASCATNRAVELLRLAVGTCKTDAAVLYEAYRLYKLVKKVRFSSDLPTELCFVCRELFDAESEALSVCKNDHVLHSRCYYDRLVQDKTWSKYKCSTCGEFFRGVGSV